MCKIMDDLINKAVKDKQIAIAMAMIEDCTLSYEKIATITELTLDELKALTEGKPA